MRLSFEEVAVVGSGDFPEFAQFEQTDGELFHLDSGRMYGTATDRLDGDFSNPVWRETHEISPDGDTDITSLELKSLSGFGLVGTYTTPTAQKLLIYEFQHDLSSYLSGGSIKHSIDSPISTFSLTLDNPVDKATVYEDEIILNEHKSLVAPGARVVFRFGMGDDEPIEMGSFYVDDTDFRVASDTASLNGRNLIGKALKDQTVNENGQTGYKRIDDILKDFLYYANLAQDQYIVQNKPEKRRYAFEPSKDLMGCFDDIFKTLITWKIEETVDSTIVVGDSDFIAFPNRSTYSFRRDRDIFSRHIKMDDAESYRKVCVHDRDWNLQVYEDVEAYTGWNLQSNKTLFVSVPEGTNRSNAEAIAGELARRLQNVGKLETFEGPFRPQLLVGDSARITDKNGQHTLGLITEITHHFGKSGFKTTFTVDSGGRLGRGRLKDFIQKINDSSSAGSIAYEDIIPEEPVIEDPDEPANYEYQYLIDALPNTVHDHVLVTKHDTGDEYRAYFHGNSTLDYTGDSPLDTVNMNSYNWDSFLWTGTEWVSRSSGSVNIGSHTDILYTSVPITGSDGVLVVVDAGGHLLA